MLWPKGLPTVAPVGQREPSPWNGSKGGRNAWWTARWSNLLCPLRGETVILVWQSATMSPMYVSEVRFRNTSGIGVMRTGAVTGKRVQNCISIRIQLFKDV